MRIKQNNKRLKSSTPTINIKTIDHLKDATKILPLGLLAFT